MTAELHSWQIKPGQYWLNTKKDRLYLVIGFTEHCDSINNTFTEVLYRSDDMPPGCYRHRPIADWFGLNTYDQPRFVPYFLLTQSQLQEIRVVSSIQESEILKTILIKMFYGMTFQEAFTMVVK